MKPTLSIGIAAYNEEQNIGALISAFLAQKISSMRLLEIFIVSDASTDKTDEIVRSFLDKGVGLIRLEKRNGLSFVQNKIMEHAQGDILVVSDADILPADPYHLENLTAPILADSSVGITSAALVPASPKAFVEKVLFRNHALKVKLFDSIGNGDNIYNCAGPSRAFSRALYKKLRYPDNIPNDAYSFFFCKEQGLVFRYTPQARAIFRLPSTLADHAKQGVRFIAGKSAILNNFGDDARKAYALPVARILFLILPELFLHPILLVSYLGMLLFVRYNAINKRFNAQWDMAITSEYIDISQL